MLLNPPLFWLIVGSFLCLMELFLPTAFVAFMMGLSALIVAAIALVIPLVNVQVLLWMILSGGLIFLVRRFIPRNSVSVIEDAKEAQTLTEIPAGETGRVIYEGNSWQARCEDEEVTIPPNQRVVVVRRIGTTLIVVPENFLRS